MLTDTYDQPRNCVIAAALRRQREQPLIRVFRENTALTYSATHEQEVTIQILDILLQQIAESYLLAHASLS